MSPNLEAVLKAAELGDASAQNNLGEMFRDGEGVARDATEAVKWFHKAAEQGDATAQLNLGSMYFTGAGVPKDDAEAVRWWRKAAEQGVVYAQFNLGTMYANGDGVPKDDAEAYAWYSIATKHSNEQAQEHVLKAKSKLTPEQLIAAEKRAAELTEQINANKAK